MSAIKVNNSVVTKKVKRLKRWVGFWLLKDMPKAKITIQRANFILDGDTTGVEIKNGNPFIETTITDCSFYPDNYEVTKKKTKNSLFQKIKDKLSKKDKYPSHHYWD